jgi:enterochelin esterase-like enzyme
MMLFLFSACGFIGLPQTSISPTLTAGQESPIPFVTKTVLGTLKATTTSTIHPTLRSPSPTLLHTPIRKTPTPTLTACMKAGGRIEIKEFTTSLLPNPMVYRIYLPPCYDEELDRFYPVLYLIHGQTYSDTQWDRLGVPETADRLIAGGETVPFIVVMPRDRVWKEPTEDNFGLAVEQSLIPWVDEHYRTIPDREHRAIGGLSRGGAWAIHLGLSHPELFGVMGVHSGFVFHSDIQQVYLWLNNLPMGMAPRIYMDVADEDRPEIAESAAFLEELLTQYDIPHEWYMFVGEHEEAYWQSHVEDYLRWYIKDW